MAEDIALSDIDKKILSMVDYSSPEQISESLGGVISPARIRLRVNDLLESQDWLTDAQRERRVLIKLQELLHTIESMVGAQFDLDNLKMQLATLKEIGNRLDKRRSALDIDLEKYDRNVALEMVRVYDLSLAYLKGALRHEIDPDRWDTITREALTHAQAEVMKKAIES